MKNERHSRGGFLIPRILLSLVLCLSAGLLAFFSLAGVPSALLRQTDDRPRFMIVPGEKADDFNRMEEEWHNRVTYPTGVFDPAWVRRAAEHDATIARGVPFGQKATNLLRGPDAPLQ